MNTPWPDDVLDCARRLAKSLGYEDSQIRVVDGKVMVYREEDESYHGCDGFYWYWHPLDPRDPTVWSALIGVNGIDSLTFFEGVYLQANRVCSGSFIACNHKGFVAVAADIGLAVCEAYNALKGNKRRKAKPPQKFSKEEICGFFKVPIDILR